MRWSAWLALAIGVPGCGTSTDEGRSPPEPTTSSDTDTPPDTAPSSETGRTDTGTPPAPSSGNVLILLADDVGVDMVEAYGSTHPAPMPVLDGLIAEGIRFTAAYAMPVCSSSRAALLTGRYGRRTGVGGVIGETEEAFGLVAGEVTLPEMLASAPDPWDSSLAGKWHLSNPQFPGWLTHPLDQGFAWSAGSMNNLGSPTTDYNRWIKVTNGVEGLSTTYATTDTVDDALDRATTMQEPWLLLVSFNAPHAPWVAPPDELMVAPRSTEDGGLYWDTLHALDTEIGRLLDGMPPDVRERTTVFWMGDNGSPSIAHRADMPGNAKGSLREGGTHVPLVVAGHGVERIEPTCDALVHLVDIFPTVAELAGVDLSTVLDDDGAPVAIDGVSLVPHLRGDCSPTREYLYNERFQPNGGGPFDMDRRSVQDHRFKLVQYSPNQLQLIDVQSWPDGNGPDLLADGVDANERAVLERLAAALEAYDQELVYAW